MDKKITLNDLNIPKKLYLYWGCNTNLSYLQFLTVKTFQSFNPEWEIIIYTPEIHYDTITWKSSEQKTQYTGKNYFDRLKECKIEFRKIDFEKIGFKNDIPEVIKSDYLRYYLLGNYGGCWVDFDVVFIKSFNEIEINNNLIMGDISNIDTVFVYNDYYPVGFLMSGEKNPIYLNLAENCKKYINKNEYQSIGARMIKKMYNTPELIKKEYSNKNILILPLDSYLPYEWNELDQIFLKKNISKIKNNTFGIHWFNGCFEAKNFQNQLEEKKNNNLGSINIFIEKYLDN